MTVKAGDMKYAVLDTSINTDEPGPVLATIVAGRFKGGKLIGTVVERRNQFSQKVLLSFNQLSLPHADNVISITAVAIDPSTSRTAFSSYTDNHILQRYGLLFASSFISGFGRAITQSGSTVTRNSGSGDTQTVTPALKFKEQVLIGLGNVGQQMGSKFAPYFARQPTIHVDSGTSMAILFLSDVKVPLKYLASR